MSLLVSVLSRRDVDGPIIMPLSNPSRLVEAKPVDILHWTNGKALVATGSPFGTVKKTQNGRWREGIRICVS